MFFTLSQWTFSQLYVGYIKKAMFKMLIMEKDAILHLEV